MLTSIIGYALIGLFGVLSVMGFAAVLKPRDTNDKINSATVFTVFGLLALGTAYIAGL